MRIRPFPALFVILALAFPPKSTSASQFNISGTGYAAPLGTHPTTTVNVYDKPTMILLNSTTTLPDGSYTIYFYPVGIENIKPSGLSGAILRNPFRESLEVAISANETGDYLLSVSDVNGSILLTKSLSLQSGSNAITISGLGAAGLKTIQLSGYGQKITLKAIQSSSGAFSPSVDITHSDLSMLKNTATSDSVLISFVPPSGYTGMDTTVAFQSQIVNYVLQQIPVEFSMVALTHKDTAVQNTSVKIQWGDGTTDTYASQNGFIHVSKYLYSITDTAYISNNDTTIYSPWLWGRMQNHPLNQANLFQSAKQPSGGLIYIPPDPAIVKISLLPDTFNLFFQVKEVDDPMHQGQKIRTYDGIDFRTLGWGSNPGVSVKYVFVPQSVDSIDNFRVRQDETTGLLVSQTLFDELCQLNDSALSLTTLKFNGIKYMPPYKTENVDYWATDPRIIEAQNRNPSMDQSILTQYRNVGTSGCHSFTTTFNGINGQPRIYYSIAKFSQTVSKAQRLTEMICQLINADDASTGGAGGFLVALPFTPTEYARVLVYTIYNDDCGTPD